MSNKKSQIHTYRAASYSEAMLKANIELGSNIRILSTTQVRTGGFFGFFSRKQIEIVVSVNEKPSLPKQESKLTEKMRTDLRLTKENITPPPDQENINKILEIIKKNKKDFPVSQNRTTSIPDPVKNMPASGAGTEQNLSSISDEIVKIRGQLNDLTKTLPPPVITCSSKFNLSDYPPDLRKLGEKLLWHKVSPDKIRTILSGIDKKLRNRGENFCWSIHDMLKEELQHILNIKHFDIHKQECFVFSLTGPTGCGKTTTIAKLAARWKMTHENLKIVMITTDTYRLGATEQLQYYHDILDIPLEVVFSEKELKEKIRFYSQDGYNIIIVDTAGRSPKSSREISDICEFLSVSDISNFLVFSANSQDCDIENIIKKFAPVHPKGCIITKTDETKRYGFLINHSDLLRNCPIYCLTDGQDIAHNLIFPSFNDLTSMFMADRNEN